MAALDLAALRAELLRIHGMVLSAATQRPNVAALLGLMDVAEALRNAYQNSSTVLRQPCPECAGDPRLDDGSGMLCAACHGSGTTPVPDPLDVRCPRCKSAPGVACKRVRSPGVGDLTPPHGERTVAAADSHALAPVNECNLDAHDDIVSDVASARVRIAEFVRLETALTRHGADSTAVVERSVPLAMWRDFLADLRALSKAEGK